MTNLQAFLDERVARYNEPGFIADDPVSIPHQFADARDREIMAFWAATLAWGQRKTIIKSCARLVELMEGEPYRFIVAHEEADRARFAGFVHRTFQYTDTLYFLEFLQWYYRRHDSLEDAFARFLTPEDAHTGPVLTGFHELFFSLPDAPQRTRKHVATPARKSSCKRLNMFLRWMVRRDEGGVDFGQWTRIQPRQLLMPLDVHVERVARRLGLLTRKQRDWLAVLELTDNLRRFDAEDPVKYDFALFGLGVLEEF
ncbi:MAG: TIGR02757 family protein [Lewinella sp.]|nr:TIGR02757 family protein [Lewinella sp.]